MASRSDVALLAFFAGSLNISTKLVTTDFNVSFFCITVYQPGLLNATICLRPVSCSNTSRCAF